MHSRNSLLVRVYSRILDLPDLDWENCVRGHFYSSIPFLHTLALAEVEYAHYRYLLFYEQDRAVGAAVLSRFDLNLDLLAGIPWLTRIKRKWPGLLRVPMICCGIPASFGQHNIHWTDNSFRNEIIGLTHTSMVKWAVESNTNLVLWKEFNPDQLIFPILKQKDYINLPTLPDNIIEYPPGGIDGFLREFRSPYRRKYALAWSLINDEHDRHNSGFVLNVTPFSIEHVDQFNKGYQMLMERTPVKLEEYPNEFFKLLSDVASPRILHFQLENLRESRSISSLVIQDDGIMFFILVSKEDERYNKSHYTNLIRCMVLYGAHKGVRRIHLGQTSYYSKLTCGSELKRLETYIYFRSRTKNKIFKRLGKLLFPEIALPTINAFSSIR